MTLSLHWSITIDVQGLSCTCRLEVSQPDGPSIVKITRVIFIGLGPHNPLLQPLHDEIIVVDEPVLLTTQGILSDKSIEDSKIFLSCCYAPNGACDGDLYTSEVNVTWGVSQQSDVGSFIIDATDLELHDGKWQFSYFLQDRYLRTSPNVNVEVWVDQTNPEAKLISPSQASEGETIIIDGSDSSDGVWTSKLQPVWYITEPDGSLRVANQSESSGMSLTLTPTLSGNYTVQLNVFDVVGRKSIETTQLDVINIAPELELRLNQFDETSPNSWQIEEDDVLEISTMVLETGDDGKSLVYEWYIDDVLVSNESELAISELDVGVHELRLIVTDDNGDSDIHEMDIIVNGKAVEEKRELHVFVIIFIVIILVGALVLTKRIRKSENESIPMPKWNSSKKKQDSTITSNSDDDVDIWEESDSLD